MTKPALPVLPGPTYRNPLPVACDLPEISAVEANANADPYVLKFGGEYYCYSTGQDGVHLLRSKDLVHFTHAGYALQMPGYVSFWAPCVFYSDGTFYMYYSCTPVEDGGDHGQIMKVATSQSPEGPFTFVKMLGDMFSIDAHVVRDTNGELYLFYAANTPTAVNGHDAGTSVVVDRLLDPFTLEGEPKPVVLPSLDEEVFMCDRFGDGRDWHTLEGAFYLENRGNAYVMYSGSAYLSPNYFLGYAVAEKSGPIGSLRWEKRPNAQTYHPLIGRTDEVMDTGHNSVAKAPNNIDDWIVYHARNRDLAPGHPMENVRNMRIDPLFWGDGAMLTPGPTVCEQSAPEMPLLRELFEDDLTRFSPSGGQWRTEGGMAVQAEQCALASLVAKDVCLANHHTEATLRWHHHHTGGRYGLYAAWAGPNDYVRVQLHVGARAVQMLAVQNGVAGPACQARLPKSFQFSAWHKLAVRRTGSHFGVLVDDIALLEADYPTAAGSVGLFGVYTGLDCLALETTAYLGLDKVNGNGFAGQLQPQCAGSPLSWQVEDDRLAALGKGAQLVLLPQQSCFSSYRFSTCAMVPQTHSAGLVAAWQDENNHLLALVNRAENEVQAVLCQNGKRETVGRVPLQGSQAELRVVKKQDSLYLLANTALLYTGPALAGGQCGFYAEKRGWFAAIELVGLQ